ncbi:MAG: DUF4956 domain-containing protein [Lachnospiraceae bacterium]|nr:DUF4956 domain-containing protein [Lachnospiraceae bacterium]MDD3615126.1 DUF4956 domain-containing protein [Lachnospiraceae bacterium]
MFTSIIDTSSGSISMESALICMAAALILGVIVAVVYMLQGKYTKNFVITLALLPALVQIVILMVNGNLGTSVAVLGTFGLIRFRSVPGTSKEITSIFFAMAIGLACGMGQVYFAVMFTLLIAVVLFLLSKSGFGERKEIDKNLKITIPEDLDYTGIFDDIFDNYTKKVQLNKVKTINLGSMYELDYQIELKDPEMEKEMLDAIRCRNGNLTIVCGRVSDMGPEL